MKIGNYSKEIVIKSCLHVLLFIFLLITSNFVLAQSQTIEEGINKYESSRVVQFEITGIISPKNAARIDSVMMSKQGIISSYTDYVSRECTVVIDENIQKKELLDILDFLGIKTENFQFDNKN